MGMGSLTPFILLYAVHDAMVKSMPGQPQAPSLAESWTVSKDGAVVDFALARASPSSDALVPPEPFRGTAATSARGRS
jgi:peptide/nickel transport system substrate-binding protein